MKLPDFAQDESMNALRRAMGAELREFAPMPGDDVLTPEAINRLATEGIEIPLDQVSILRDGTLAYKGRRVVLYIRDVRQFRNRLPADGGLPRYHVTDCDKLKEMRANHRYERYVVATRETGEFRINLMRNDGSHQESDEQLNVCQFCLGRLNWDNFTVRRQHKRERQTVVRTFTLARYFSVYPKTFIQLMPQHTEQTAPHNKYTRDFPQIAEGIKRKRDYRCEACNVDLSGQRRFLHAHHKNGIQNDNREDNIEVLCIEHHAQRPYHSHMKQHPDFWLFLRLKEAGTFSR
jgi:hypothetical protein